MSVTKSNRLKTVWYSMRSRCYNPNATSYENYGARGIRICDEWLNDFGEFEAWAMAAGYDPDAPRGKCTIDRIDNDGNYEPSNCRWVSMSEQRRNERKPGKGRKGRFHRKYGRAGDGLAGVFGASLRARRAEMDISQGELAKRSHTSVESIQNWENGDYMPSLRTTIKLADALGVTIEQLAGRA